MNKESLPYKALCTEYYELDKPTAPVDALQSYLRYAEEANGPILEPMCGSGRYLIPLLKQGYEVTGFDNSPHMLDVCRKKCEDLGLKVNLFEASFENILLNDTYSLIIIPSSSFCLLTSIEQINTALTFISNRLKPGGKFVFEIETLWAVEEKQGEWQGKWVNRANGSKIVLNTLTQFNPNTSIQTALCRYELWENNAITQIEVEDFQMKMYDPAEIEDLLKQHGLTIVGIWQADPYDGSEADDSSLFIQYECMKA